MLVLIVILSVLGYDAGRSVQIIGTMGKEQCYQDEELPTQHMVLFLLNQDWPTWWTKQSGACYWKNGGFIDKWKKRRKQTFPLQTHDPCAFLLKIQR